MSQTSSMDSKSMKDEGGGGSEGGTTNWHCFENLNTRVAAFGFKSLRRRENRTAEGSHRMGEGNVSVNICREESHDTVTSKGPNFFVSRTSRIKDVGVLFEVLVCGVWQKSS